MKLNSLLSFCILSSGLFFMREADCGMYHQVYPAGDITASYTFIENNIDDDYFIFAPQGSTEAGVGGIGGANRWNASKGAPNGTQRRLGSLASYSHSSRYDHFADMWLLNSPVEYPLLGETCSSTQSGCSSAGIFLNQSIDSKGFYQSRSASANNYKVSGVLSDAFYQYLRRMAIASSFSMTMNSCTDTIANYTAYPEPCETRNYSMHYQQKVTLIKKTHLKLINTNSVDEVFINSDGTPTPAEGNINCRVQTVGNKSGLACKMVSYSLQSNGESLADTWFYPMIINSSLASAVGTGDMQVSLTGSSWKPLSAAGTVRPSASNAYTLEDMKASDALYVFFSLNFFKQLIALGISDVNSQDLFKFRVYGDSGLAAGASEYGYYLFNTSNSLLIKPREFSVSITSDDYSNSPAREGYVGSSQPSLDFNYIVTTSGKTAADEVQIKVTGPTEMVNGRPHCIFSSSEPVDKVPFPATLSLMTQSGSTKTYDVGCDGRWRDMSDALWLSSSWTDISGQPGVMDKATVKFSILMDDIISMRTLGSHSGWYGEVNASGEVYVKATWRDIN